MKRSKELTWSLNNAGRFNCIAGVHELDPEDWWEDVRVNLFGPLLLIRQILPLMMQRDQGVIINMDGGRPVGGTGYACSKAGLMQLNEILAKELKMFESNVIVLGAGPGLVRTEMTELQANSEAGRKWIPSTKECLESGNIRKPEEIARATIKALLCVKPEHSGQYIGPDFSGFQL
ncbi:MAG: SDR family oxidoreductase [Phycisphaerae bacterium]|nr:SDR family oxidoreductase [Phycisphaerae bacterium]